MTERAGHSRRDVIRGGLFGLAIGLAGGGTAEQQNVLDRDRPFEELQRGFREFADFVCSRTDLDTMFPGGIRRLTDDERLLRFLFSIKQLEKEGGGSSTHYQLLVPSDERSLSSLSPTITMTASNVSGKQPFQKVVLSALFVPGDQKPIRHSRADLDAGEWQLIRPPTDTTLPYRLADFGNFEYPRTSIMTPAQLVELASQVMTDSYFGADEEWDLWDEESEVVPGEVLKVGRWFQGDPRSTGVAIESSGYFEYTEYIRNGVHTDY